ncbi:unnamed protein product, partial [Ectocarpus fasciculatus]
ISDGGSDAYDGWAYLTIDGSRWYSSDSTAWGLEDDREHVTDWQYGTLVADLDVQRKTYVPDGKGLGYARHTEVLYNSGKSTLTVDLQIYGNLGSDESNNTFSMTSSGDSDYDSTDVWAMNHQDSSDPALGFIFPGATLSKSGGAA